MENKAVNRKYEHVTAIYWCVWTAVYLAISLPTMRWDITWVVWPVAWSIVWGTSGVFEDKESESRARISGLQGEIRTA